LGIAAAERAVADMSYSDFTLDSLRHAFGLMVRDQVLFEQVGTIEPSHWLQEALEKGQDLAFISEKARSEFIVAPVLMACRGVLGQRFRIFSGARLDVDPERGLKGECDFILGRSESSLVFQAPLMVILEAKKNDIEEGLGQCAAQMLGARIYNEKEGKALPFLYGCVTTGESWQFLKLKENDIIIHPERYPIQELAKVLWFLVQCLREVDRGGAAEAAA
jgi:hypothetical protein